MAKGDKFYFDNFMECASLSKQAAEYLVSCLENFDADKIEEMLDTMHSFEHSADKKKHEMSEALAKAFVTPVDREDLDLMSHQLDNVLDIMEEVLQKLYIYDIKTIEASAVEYAKNLVRSCDLLCSIMGEFENFKKSKKIHALIVECNDVEEECDKLYLSTVRAITKNSSDTLEKLSWYKIFDCFEECADACEHVSDCVGSIIMKNT
ncbi:MAG: DUF47 family protein [Ruminococcaceae bacterium]|nr:DUF47 family protein [Oscillospiraceae bacterium]